MGAQGLHASRQARTGGPELCVRRDPSFSVQSTERTQRAEHAARIPRAHSGPPLRTQTVSSGFCSKVPASSDSENQTLTRTPEALRHLMS